MNQSNSLKLSDLGLQTAVENRLRKHADINTVSDLTTRSMLDLLRVPGVAGKTITHIKERLAAHGLCLSEERNQRVPTLTPWIFNQDAQPDAGVEVIVLDLGPGSDFDITTAAREHGSDWTDPTCKFWRMPIPPLPQITETEHE